MEKVLVTGATGFVGSHALEALAGEGKIEVVAACRRRESLLPAFRGEVREGDFRDPHHLKTLFQGVDTLVNGFAWTSAWGHIEASDRYFYRPTLALLDAAIEGGVKRIINISSTSAAAPDRSSDPMSRGIIRGLWPHLDNVIRIENFLRERADRVEVINLRFGIFAGRRYALGILPILLPRLKTHLVPWVAGGKTSCPIVDGRDIGQAIRRAVLAPSLQGFQSFNIVGPEVPTVRMVIDFLHREYGYPRPHFGVPFAVAYPFARLMEWLDPILPWEPLVTRSIIHLMEEVNADNERAEAVLGFRPEHHWKAAIRLQLEEMEARQKRAMPLTRPLV